MKKYFIITVLLISGIYSTAQQQVVPYTLADRDRLIQVEANVNGVRNEMGSLRNEMNAKFDAVNNRFDAVNNRFDAVDAKFDAMNSKIDSLYWFQGVVVALIIFILGFIIWDRRTTLAPINSEIEKLKQANEKMKAIFIKQAESQPKLLEILKNAGIL
jgi:hypothetical protein